MNFNFELLQLKKVSSVRDWHLKINSVKELMEYTAITEPVRVEKAFTEYLRVEEGKAHFTDRTIAYLCYERARCQETTFIEAMLKVLNSSLQNKIKHLLKGNIIFINSMGGYSMDTQYYERYDVLKTITKNELGYFTSVSFN